MTWNKSLFLTVVILLTTVILLSSIQYYYLNNRLNNYHRPYCHIFNEFIEMRKSPFIDKIVIINLNEIISIEDCWIFSNSAIITTKDGSKYRVAGNVCYFFFENLLLKK